MLNEWFRRGLVLRRNFIERNRIGMFWHDVLGRCYAPAVSWLIVAMACSEVRPYRPEPGELFPDGKPLGQPYSAAHREIRMVRVSSVEEADSFYRALQDKYPECGTVYTYDVPDATYEVGIIRIMDSAVVARGIREIHFVETVKTAGK